MGLKKKIYVVAFGPSENSPNGVGGHDWYFTRADAVARLQDHIIDEGYDYSFFEAYVPEEILQNEPDWGLVESYLDAHYTEQMI